MAIFIAARYGTSVPALALIAGTTAVLLVWLHRSDKRRKERLAAERSRDNDARIAYLLAGGEAEKASRRRWPAIMPGEPEAEVPRRDAGSRATQPRRGGVEVEVRGASLAILYFLVLSAGLMMLPLLLANWQEHTWPDPAAVLGAIVFIGLGLGGLLLHPPLFGRPIVTLSDAGLRAPSCGFVPWESVQGISLLERHARGVVFRFLCLAVPDLGQYVARLGPLNRARYRLQRLISRGMPQVLIPLRRTSEEPEVVLAVAKTLWHKRTGRSYAWDPRFTDEENAALRGIETGWKEITTLAQSPGAPASAVDAKLAEQERHFDVLAKAAERRARALRWLVWATMIGFVVYAAAAFLRYLYFT